MIATQPNFPWKRFLWGLPLLAASVLTARADAKGMADTAATAGQYGRDYTEMLDSCEFHISKGNWKEAEKSVRNCLKTYPGSPLNGMLFYNLAMAQMGQEKYREAEESLTIALVRADNNPQYLLGRAKCRLLMKLPAKAMEDLDRILHIDSLNFDALYSRSVAERLTGRERKSAEDLRTILRHHPDDLPALSALGSILLEEGEYQQAAGLLEKAVGLYSAKGTLADGSADARFMLIMAHLFSDNYESSEEAIREALKIFPRDGRFYMTRAILERKRFQNNDAELDKKIAAQYGVEPQILEYYVPGKK